MKVKINSKMTSNLIKIKSISKYQRTYKNYYQNLSQLLNIDQIYQILTKISIKYLNHYKI